MTLAQSADELITRARRTTSNDPGMCLWQSQEWYGSPHMYADATRQWQAAQLRHPGDRNPPRGAHVMWTGGSRGHGHSAISLGNGRIRTIDFDSAGRTGETDLDWVEKAWGLRYEGWTEDIGGVRIPWLAGSSVAPPVNPHGVKIGDTAIVVTRSAPLLGRQTPGGRLTGVEREPGFTFEVRAMTEGWASGGHNWYSTDYLWPRLVPDPVNAAGIKKGDWVRVVTPSGLRARRFPGGPVSIDKNGRPIVRNQGWSFAVSESPVSGWVTGGSHWYSSQFLEVTQQPARTGIEDCGWVGPTITLRVSGMPDTVTYLQSLVRVAPLSNENGSWPERFVMAQDPGKRGDTRFVLFDATGHYLDEMLVRDGGHGQTFHAYRSAAGVLWVWTMIGTRAFRIPWRSRGTITASSDGVEPADFKGRRPVGTHEPYVGFRGANDTRETFSLHDRVDFVGGNTTPLLEVTVPKRTSMTQQTWALSPERIYRLMGATNQVPGKGTRRHILDVFSWDGALLVDRLDVTAMTVPTTSDEPEGLTFTGSPGQLLAGKREGGSKPKRSYPIWTITGV